MMSEREDTAAFENRTREMLDESTTRVDARIRSRLNQARHAALAEASRAREGAWRNLGLVPAGGAVAAAILVALVLWGERPQQTLPVNEGPQAAFDDLELLADDEVFDLMEQGDGSFYEWAVSQIELEGKASG